jgi:hypothetical protein
MNGFIDHFPYTRLVTTSSYSSTANLQNSQITTSSAKPLCFHQPFPGNGFKSGDSSASRTQALSSQSPEQKCLYMYMIRGGPHSAPARRPSLSNCAFDCLMALTPVHTIRKHNWLCHLLITSRHGPRRNTPFPTVPLLLRAHSLPQEPVYRAVAQKQSLFSESPPSNGSIRHSMFETLHFLTIFYWNFNDLYAV